MTHLPVGFAVTFAAPDSVNPVRRWIKAVTGDNAGTSGRGSLQEVAGLE